MTRRYILFCFYCFCFVNLFGQRHGIDSLAMVIDEQVERITAIADWESVASFQIENFASKEAFLKLYYFEGNLKKVELSRADVYSKRENTYYLKNERLTFVSEKNSEYRTAIDNKDHEVSDTIVYETFSYFHEDVLILQLDNEYTGSSLSKEFLKALGGSILDDFKVLIELSETAK